MKFLLTVSLDLKSTLNDNVNTPIQRPKSSLKRKIILDETLEDQENVQVLVSRIQRKEEDRLLAKTKKRLKKRKKKSYV